MGEYWVQYKLYEKKVFQWSIKDSSLLDTLWKIFHTFLNSIDCEILFVHGGMRFENDFKSYSKNQWL